MAPKIRFFLPLAVISIVILGTAFGQTTSTTARLVRNLKNNQVDGCGCYFRFRGTPESSDRYIFTSSIDDEKSAWMNIEGRDTKLMLIKERAQRQRERVGDRSTERFAVADITVNVTYVVTRVCRPNDESCESTDYSASFVVKKGRKSEVVKAVGGCGC